LTDCTIAAKWRHDHLTDAAYQSFRTSEGFQPSQAARAMIAFLSRFVGIWLIAGALVAVVVDGAKTIAATSLTVTPLGLTWFTLSPTTLMAAQGFVQQTVESYIGHWLWDPLIQWLLLLPSWAVLGAVGGTLAYLGRKRRFSPVYA